MAIQIVMKFHLAVILLLPVVVTATPAVTRPANLGRPDGERPGNLTIDQIIRNARRPDRPHSLTGNTGTVLVELDMRLTRKQYEALYPNDQDRSKRKATKDLKLRWTNKTIPYRFYVDDFYLDEQYWVRRALTDWERYTCINFRPATKDDLNWVRFQNGDGCESQLGMVGGMQAINLDVNGCRFKGLYLHETGHAIGLYHEHQVPLRDDYIWIDWQNVMPGWEDSFTKYSTAAVDNMGVKYDYSSIMHYGVTAFSKDGKGQTIHARYSDKEDEIGRVYLKELSWSDIAVVNKMYQCAAHCPDQTKCGADGVLDENCRCICKDGSHDSCDQTLTADSSCVNEDPSWKCYIWANQGECERNPEYMKQYCKKACQVCGSLKSSPQSPCKNNYQDKKCNMWKKRGDCVANKRWMTQHCPVACNFCTKKDTEIQESCENKHNDLDQCTDWATSGECVINPDGMFLHCRKSCLACNNTGGHVGFGDNEIATKDIRPPDNYDCDDKHPKCTEWARGRECEQNPNFMIYNCRKACGKCEDGTCKNIFTDQWCMSWTQSGECSSNPTWMERNCAKACRVCKNTKPTTTRITPSYECLDRNDQCRGWAAGDQCDANAGWMIDNCRKACGKCDDGSCKNLWSDMECSKWAGEGECTASPDWMGKNCAQSCGVGICEGQPTNIPPKTPYPRPQTTAPAKICKNDHNDKECDDWAATDQCSLNPGYMLKHCAGSCRVCGGGTDIDDITPAKICKNNHNDKECDTWAAGNQCSLNPGFMLNFCAGSCRVCGGGTDIDDAINKPHPNCQDKHQSCKAWTAAGYCDNSSSVLKLCQFSCDNCGCKDESDQCAVWAQKGTCSTNAQYMMRSCQKACGVC